MTKRPNPATARTMNLAGILAFLLLLDPDWYLWNEADRGGQPVAEMPHQQLNARQSVGLIPALDRGLKAISANEIDSGHSVGLRWGEIDGENDTAVYVVICTFLAEAPLDNACKIVIRCPHQAS